MSRERPIKLHIKDGKDTIFRLIGPKGRVLNSLNWDGESLSLMDASSDEDISEAPVIDDDESTNMTTNDENLVNILGEDPPASPADEPQTEEDLPPTVGASEGVEDVSGDSEAEITDSELAEILEEDSNLTPDIEESDEQPDKEDSSDTDDVEEKKKPF